VLIEQQNSRNYGPADFKQCVSCNSGLLLQEFSIVIGFVGRRFVLEGVHVYLWSGLRFEWNILYKVHGELHYVETKKSASLFGLRRVVRAVFYFVLY
jgi:hypothetical protein